LADNPKTPTENAQEVFDLVKAYAIQETTVPLQGIGTYLKFGVPGSILMGTGLFFLALALLRGLQQFEMFTGHEDGQGWLVFVPYLSVFVAAAIILYFLVKSITKGLDS